MKLLEFFIDISVRSGKATAGLAAVEGRANRTKASLGGAGVGAAGLASRLIPMAALAYGAGRALGAVVTAGSNFQAQMNAVSAITGATGDELDELSDKARQLGRETKFSATEAASGMETLARNGLTTEQILGGALDASLLLASALKTDLATASDFATDVMGQFQIPAENMIETVDLLAGAARSSKFDVNDLWLAFAQGGGTAAQMGVELEEFLTTVSLISPNFKSGSDAGTSFKTFLTRLPGLTKPAREQLSRLGMEFFDVNGNLKDMPAIIEELREGLGDLNDEEAITAVGDIFGVDAMRAALALARTDAESYDETLERIRATSAQEMSDTQMQGVAGSWKELKSALEAVAITLFEGGIGGALEGILDFVTWIVRKFDDFLNFVQLVSDAFDALMPKTDPAVWEAFGAALTLVGDAFNAVFTAIGDVLRTIVEMRENGATLGEVWSYVGALIMNNFINPIVNGFQWIIDLIKQVIDWIANIKWPQPPEWMRNAAGAVGDFFGSDQPVTSPLREGSFGTSGVPPVAGNISNDNSVNNPTANVYVTETVDPAEVARIARQEIERIGRGSALEGTN